MIHTAIKHTERKPAKTFVNLSRMDYEIVCSILKILNEINMDDVEFSFLLGKRNQYLFNLIDPREKQKLKTDQLDPLRAILGIPYRHIIPLDIAAGEMIQLHHAVRKVDGETGTMTYSHIIYSQGDTKNGKKVIWKKAMVRGIRRRVNKPVHALLKRKWLRVISTSPGWHYHFI